MEAGTELLECHIFTHADHTGLSVGFSEIENRIRTPKSSFAFKFLKLNQLTREACVRAPLRLWCSAAAAVPPSLHPIISPIW
jgi:hypothetical protein